MPSRPVSKPKLASVAETEPVRGKHVLYDEVSARLSHVVHFFHIHDRHQLDRYDSDRAGFRQC